MPMVKREKSVDGKWKYAPFEDIWPIARPILEKTGFTVSFEQEDNEAAITVTCVAFNSGHTRRTPYTIPKDEQLRSSGGKEINTKAQTQAKSSSFCKRQAFVNAFTIVCTNEDVDGHLPGPTLDAAQADRIRELVDQVKSKDDLARFWPWIGAESPEGIPAARFVRAETALGKIIAKQGGAA